MTIKIGDKIPSVTLHVMGSKGPEPLTTEDLFANKVVAMFGVPGAFTPTCSEKHLPGYVKHAGKFKKSGADEIVCISVNDAFVMGAWGKQQGAVGKVTMVADGSGRFARAAGLELNLADHGLGVRCQRFAMIVENGVVKDIVVEPKPGEADKSTAEKMLERMSKAYLDRGGAKTGL
jgi:peroxiredoxin